MDNDEERGLKWIQEHRREIIKCFNKPKGYFFRKYSDHVETATNGLRRIYIDNGSDVLLVAHLDTVHDDGRGFSDTIKGKTVSGFHWNRAKDKDGNAIIKTPTCDDRLGVATIMVILPALGINADILLTEGEESGRSTARGFSTDKKYNWIAEFDRGGSALFDPLGDDGVLYGFDDNEWREILLSSGWLTVGRGSFSDIAALEHLGCKGANWAIGYHDYHSWKAYFVVAEWARAVKMFKEFYETNKDTHFPHTPKPVYRPATTTNSYYTSVKPKVGMVVMSSGKTRKDGRPTIGIVAAIHRTDIWVVVDNDRNVIDTPKTWDILKHVKCQNCFAEMEDYFAYLGNKIVCQYCEDTIKQAAVPEGLFQSFFLGTGSIQLGDSVAVVESLSKEGALLSVGEAPFFLGYEHLFGVREPENQEIKLVGVTSGDKFFLKKREGGKIYVEVTGSDIVYALPEELLA